MSLDEKIYSLFIVTPEQLFDNNTLDGDYLTRENPELIASLEQKPVSGVILFGGNIKYPYQTKEFTNVFASRGMFVAVDEEGGKVARIGNNNSFPVPVFSAADECSDPYYMYKTISSYLKYYGFNLDFAPVADISVDGGGVIGSRAFASDPELVSQAVYDSVSGFIDSCMLCSLKHFPGHGATTADSHNGAAILDKTREELDDWEFQPFMNGIKAGAPVIMIGHIIVPEITGNLPATLSEPMIDILRNDFNFDGLVITDSFRMKAITDSFSAGEAALMALKAGVDIVLMPDNLDKAYDAVKKAVTSGELSEEAINKKLFRIINLKYSYGIIPLETFETADN